MSLIINRIIDNFLLSNDIILSHDFTILITPSYYNIPSTTKSSNSVEFEQISRRSRRNSEIRGTNDRRDYIRKPKRRGVQEFGKSLIKSNRSLANSNPAIWTPPPSPCHPSNWSYRPRQITDLPFSSLPPRSFSYYVAARISGRC